MRRERDAYSVDPKNEVEAAAVRAAQAAMSRARRSGLPFDPDLPATLLAALRAQEGRCALSGVPLTIEVHGAGAAPPPFAPSIDRIRSEGCYTGGNCRVVAWAVNCFCSVWGDEFPALALRGVRRGAIRDDRSRPSSWWNFRCGRWWASVRRPL